MVRLLFLSVCLLLVTGLVWAQPGQAPEPPSGPLTTPSVPEPKTGPVYLTEPQAPPLVHIPEPHAVLAMPTGVQGFQTPHDLMPNVCATPTVTTTAPAAWSTLQVGSQDIVMVKHDIDYDSLTGHVRHLCVGTGATLRFPPDKSTRLVLSTLQIQPGGTLEMGSYVTPINPNVTVSILFDDIPLDVSPDTEDPFQISHGVVAIDAHVRMHGAAKTPYVRAAAEPLKGQTTLTLATAPQGWQVGDRLVLPDTRQLQTADIQPKSATDNNVRRRVSQSEVVVIAALQDTTITLATPLQFDHEGARDHAGVLTFLPHVANLTRNIVFASANPAGTRGHGLFTGTGSVDIQHAAFVGMGRTKAEPLNNTSLDASGAISQIGTNQIGRYPLHMHHFTGTCPGTVPLFTLRGNVVEATTGRWGLAIHDTSYGLIEENVVFDAAGAGITTENGFEYENTFRRNFVIKSENKTVLTALDIPVRNTDPLGRKGNGYWWRGHANHVLDNIAADTREGIGWYSGSSETGATGWHIPVNLPKFPCARTTVAGEYTAIDLAQVPNGTIRGNEAYSTSEFGMSYWFFGQKGPTIVDQKIWHARGFAIFLQYVNPRWEGLIIRNQGFQGTGIGQFNNLHGGPARISQFDIQGVDTGYKKVGQLGLAPKYEWADGVMHAVHGFQLPHRGQSNQGPNGTMSHFTFRNVRFAPVAGQAWHSFELPTDLRPGLDNNGLTRREVHVEAYQGDPQQNFRLYYHGQAPDAITPGPNQFGVAGGCPEAGLTNAQCWEKYQKAFSGEVAPCTDDTTHSEIVGYACGTSTPLPVPSPVGLTGTLR